MIVPFPRDTALISTAFEIFRGTRESLLVLAPLVFVSRALLNIVTMQGHIHHWKVLSDTLLFFIGVYCLESLLQIIMEIPAQAQTLLANKTPVVLDNVPNTFYLMDLTIGISKLVDLVTILIFHILSIVYLCFMSLAIIFGGYVIFFSTMFQVRKAFSIFIMIIFFLSLWPFIWFSIDSAFEHVLRVQNANGSAAGTTVTIISLALMKLLVPVGGFLAAVKAPVGFMAVAANAIKSGYQPVGFSSRAIGTGAHILSQTTGLSKTARYITSPISSSLASRAMNAKLIAQDTVPFAAYKTSQLFGSSQKNSSFYAFKSEMNKVIAVSATRNLSVTKSQRLVTGFDSNQQTIGRNTNTVSIKDTQSINFNKSAEFNSNISIKSDYRNTQSTSNFLSKETNSVIDRNQRKLRDNLNAEIK